MSRSYTPLSPSSSMACRGTALLYFFSPETAADHSLGSTAVERERERERETRGVELNCLQQKSDTTKANCNGLSTSRQLNDARMAT
jgi:hypothetical protein